MSFLRYRDCARGAQVLITRNPTPENLLSCGLSAARHCLSFGAGQQCRGPGSQHDAPQIGSGLLQEQPQATDLLPTATLSYLRLESKDKRQPGNAHHYSFLNK